MPIANYAFEADIAFLVNRIRGEFSAGLSLALLSRFSSRSYSPCRSVREATEQRGVDADYMMSGTIAVNLPTFTLLLRKDGSAELLRLPTLSEGTINELIQIARRLPEDVCFDIDRKDYRIRIIRRPLGKFS